MIIEGLNTIGGSVQPVNNDWIGVIGVKKMKITDAYKWYRLAQQKLRGRLVDLPSWEQNTQYAGNRWLLFADGSVVWIDLITLKFGFHNTIPEHLETAI